MSRLDSATPTQNEDVCSSAVHDDTRVCEERSRLLAHHRIWRSSIAYSLRSEVEAEYEGALNSVGHHH